jgi:hypothetical protein
VHLVFVKATQAKRITDTVFFKHKYITQPTITKADAIVNAYRKLADAINSIQHSQDDAHLEALQRLQETLQPGNQSPIDKYAKSRPRVEQTEQVCTSEQHPRVQFDDTTEKPARLVVALPKKQIVQLSPPKKQVTKPTLILKAAHYVVKPDSIEDRVKARHAAPTTSSNIQSIAERVAARRRGQGPPPTETVYVVLDQETGQLLEYRQLLKHPHFKAVWSRSSADKFGRLAQGIGR